MIVEIINGLILFFCTVLYTLGLAGLGFTPNFSELSIALGVLFVLMVVDSYFVYRDRRHSLAKRKQRTNFFAAARHNLILFGLIASFFWVYTLFSDAGRHVLHIDVANSQLNLGVPLMALMTSGALIFIIGIGNSRASDRALKKVIRDFIQLSGH
jgi:hypothetical protein